MAGEAAEQRLDERPARFVVRGVVREKAGGLYSVGFAEAPG
jgi:hypothetical protein